ncbi:MAG: glycosyltransferase family 2 protein [Actinomycetota bacterium]|nr:glycosyltransferase family 2 protein [Actinomycetota bacterium]
MSATGVQLSIVSTLYRSSPTIEQFIRRSAAAARELAGESFEIVIVNDGSPDDSIDKVRALRGEFPQIVLVDLSRNFGHHVALLEGLRYSRGELVYLIDSDLEEAPEWVADFRDKLTSNQADVVFGYQETRKGSAFERLSGAIYWWVFRRLSDLDLPANVVTCRLMTRRYVDAVNMYGERELSFGGVLSVAGFVQVGTPVAKGDKESSSYSLRLKIWHMANSISAFSVKPLNAIFALGIAVCMVASLVVVYLVSVSLFWNRSPTGWTSVIVSVWLLGGLTLTSLGVIAIYLGKTLSEVKARPRAIVRSIERS